ncbi:hypothetical protein PIB30_074909 [Stylosanthes scabra]|uniref:Uncharacterized protein n=1 Tax=Stylosanthes scabra TaxID=79078 RepID=A0ABU6VP96_9FABA|nr:hypothetical protein [Stylosanthes scabra]
MAQHPTPTNGGSTFISTIGISQQSSKRTRAIMSSALNGVPPIQPRRLFHSDITHGSTISINRREHAKGGAVLPPWWTGISFKPTPLMMLSELEVAVAAYTFLNMLEPSEELVISNEKGYRSTVKCLMPEHSVESRVINLVALMMTCVFRHRSKDFDPNCWFMPGHFARFALSDKYKPTEVVLDFFGAYMSKKVSQLIRVSNSTKMRLAGDLILKKYNDLSPIIEMNATKFKSTVEEEHEDIRE